MERRTDSLAAELGLTLATRGGEESRVPGKLRMAATSTLATAGLVDRKTGAKLAAQPCSVALEDLGQAHGVLDICYQRYLVSFPEDEIAVDGERPSLPNDGVDPGSLAQG